nr:hypothetical protein BaRGS_025911 [Batillaria attramentaria]
MVMMTMMMIMMKMMVIKMITELDIQRIGDKACGKLSLDPGSGAKGNRQGRNLVVKARRKMLTLKISPTVMGRHQRKARSSGAYARDSKAECSFYLKFSRRKNEQKREKGKHRACYKVSIRGKAERKVRAKDGAAPMPMVREE